MHYFIKLTALIIPMSTLMVMYQQCSEVSFKNSQDQAQWSYECAQGASECKETTESFNSGTANKKIDFIWVVDNSGSMKEEVEKTRNNIQLFAETLAGYTDLKMALVSAKDSTTNPGDSNPQYFTMPQARGLASVQVNAFVASNDSLILGGLATCPPNAESNSWCTTIQNEKKDFDNVTISNTYWNRNYAPVVSSLSGFMRDQSHKVYVIVSDDDARKANNPYRVLSEQFLDAYDSRFPNSAPIVYSIVSPRTVDEAKSAGCAVYGQGNEYVKLSNLTGGKVFDICQNDWKPYFDEMLKGISTLAKSSFPLATVNVVEILSVTIKSGNNSRVLASGEYTYANRTVSIREDILDGYTNFDVDIKILEYVP